MFPKIQLKKPNITGVFPVRLTTDKAYEYFGFPHGGRKYLQQLGIHQPATNRKEKDSKMCLSGLRLQRTDMSKITCTWNESTEYASHYYFAYVSVHHNVLSELSRCSNIN